MILFILQCNRIHHSKRSGIVVLGSGRGQIKSNEIYQNKEAQQYLTSYCSEILPDNTTTTVQYVDTSFFVLIDLVAFNLTTPTS
jgi:parallel beta-helix repeat protein